MIPRAFRPESHADCECPSMQVDKHIRRLDADLARFEADLKDKLEGSDFESTGGRGLKSKS